MASTEVASMFNHEIPVKLHDKIFTEIIHKLLPLTQFNPITRKVQAVEDEDCDCSGFDDRCENGVWRCSDDAVVCPFVQKSIEPGWWNRLVYINGLTTPHPITLFEISNRQGFNDDCRSHRGDTFPENVPIPGEFSDRIEDGDNDKYMEMYIDDIRKYHYVLNLDQDEWSDSWGQEYPEGQITWGDVMTGVMMCKGSKYDLWYELFGNAKVLYPTRWVLKVSLDFDHGS